MSSCKVITKYCTAFDDSCEDIRGSTFYLMQCSRFSNKWKLLSKEAPNTCTNWKKLYWDVKRTNEEAARLREFAELFAYPRVPTYMEEEDDDDDFFSDQKYELRSHSSS